MRRPNFTECGYRYMSNATLVERYHYSGLVPTLTTWILPILGTLLQAPFESNAFWRTVKAVNRWIGSPMSSFASILCNIEYKMKPVTSMAKEAEGLLRIALFSEELTLPGSRKTLSQLHAKLTNDLRSNRRRGVVPIFISTLWFLLVWQYLDIGSNVQAHILAMGLFLAWFPVLILCSILDRNPMGSDNIQRKLNKLFDLVCMSLQDETTRYRYIASFNGQPHAAQMAYWVEKISAKAQYIQHSYFCGFAGQARTRFQEVTGLVTTTRLEPRWSWDKSTTDSPGSMGASCGESTDRSSL
ncbi:uncharacterized protein CC84DRAFT_1186919 [Paraphaeosphaeria sporulosa]|uniref:Uncharacterized protein n=1 Tax=Paraphaeosphaeria sporulosa TaxID=1460663 RepID=A0A177CDR2_9PLEO|nr:uncharacterized protein CC84DRAFT_1186919 [Paraphaeosphaeria sporulosa]OAG05775.1 hypothetical protein CC84DRAFT_1186919 [Paraphaeosphaeria sporulosa]